MGDDIYTKVIISMTTFLYIIKSIFNYYINGVSKVITLTTIKTIVTKNTKMVCNTQTILERMLAYK